MLATAAAPRASPPASPHRAPSADPSQPTIRCRVRAPSRFRSPDDAALGQEAMQEREMTMSIRMTLLAATLLAAPAGAMAENADTAGAQQPAAAPPPLVVHFDTGSTAIRPGDAAVLDKAARAFNEGKPLVMILTGSSDRVGG